jgi:DNA-binding NarL/FixJ family response regulator
MRHVLIVDDHSLVRAGILTLIGQIDPTVRVSEAKRCSEAIAMLQKFSACEESCDLVLLDLNLPDYQGFDALVSFRAALPEVPVVVISGQDDSVTVLRALELGARSFLSKADDPDQTRLAMEALLHGEVWVPRDAMAGWSASSESGPDGAGFGELTERQIEVLSLVVQGLSNKLIARRLGIAESTVKIHVSAILREFGVATRTQVVLEVAKRRLRFPTEI